MSEREEAWKVAAELADRIKVLEAELALANDQARSMELNRDYWMDKAIAEEKIAKQYHALLIARADQ